MDNYTDSHDITLRMQQDVDPYHHPKSFFEFFSEWIYLLQNHVFPNYIVRFNDRRVNEGATIRTFGEASELVWPRLSTIALTELVHQRYIRTHVLGRTPDDDTEFVREMVKDAIDYLRVVLGVSPSDVVGRVEPCSFESGQPADLSNNIFALNQHRFSAAMTILYQIRCNLFHGVKGYRNGSKRDELLTTLGALVLRDVNTTLDGKA